MHGMIELPQPARVFIYRIQSNKYVYVYVYIYTCMYIYIYTYVYAILSCLMTMLLRKKKKKKKHITIMEHIWDHHLMSPTFVLNIDTMAIEHWCLLCGCVGRPCLPLRPSISREIMWNPHFQWLKTGSKRFQPPEVPVFADQGASCWLLKSSFP